LELGREWSRSSAYRQHQSATTTTREAAMLIWASLLVLAGCTAALAVWPLAAGATEVVALVGVAAAFTAICAIEARHQR